MHGARKPGFGRVAETDSVADFTGHGRTPAGFVDGRGCQKVRGVLRPTPETQSSWLSTARWIRAASLRARQRDPTRPTRHRPSASCIGPSVTGVHCSQPVTHWYPCSSRIQAVQAPKNAQSTAQSVHEARREPSKTQPIGMRPGIRRAVSLRSPGSLRGGSGPCLARCASGPFRRPRRAGRLGLRRGPSAV